MSKNFYQSVAPPDSLLPCATRHLRDMGVTHVVVVLHVDVGIIWRLVGVLNPKEISIVLVVLGENSLRNVVPRVHIVVQARVIVRNYGPIGVAAVSLWYQRVCAGVVGVSGKRGGTVNSRLGLVPIDGTVSRISVGKSVPV